jgi:hypothetical protein
MRTEAAIRGAEPSTLNRRPLRVKPSHVTVLGPIDDIAGVTYLPDGGIWSRVPTPMGLRVTSLRGNLWLTQAGGAGDVILREGESFATILRGKVVVQAMGAASLTYDDRA